MGRHPYAPKTSFDGGDLDCGNGLLLLIRQHIDPLETGELIEIRSTEISVPEDLPAWCRLTGNELVHHVTAGREHSFLVSKGKFDPARAKPASAARAMPLRERVVAVRIKGALPAPAPAPAIAPLSVMGVGSWPRPAWLLDALHRHLEGRLDDAQFEAAADDAVRLCVDAQLRAGVDVLTDGEQRRDNYASFVGGILDNCQLIPITDLLPYVEHPEQFERELRALDVPAGKVRHPAVFGPLGRSRPIALHEARFLRELSDKPRKIALPGPYLLTRTMWMECISDRAYANREELARDIVRVLREELAELLAEGVSLVQFDEPVLSEVVFGHARERRTFMCGALGEKLDTPAELAFAERLLAELTDGFPRERLALHVCRGNWSPDESVALHGDYGPLLPLLARVSVGTLLLELCTPRAGDARLLAELPRGKRIGIGVVNQKRAEVESADEICARIAPLVELLGPERVLLNPDCGFATFADNPLASSAIASRKLASIADASRTLRARCFGA
ncbi:MAG: 5-methyltetrahydropteroyltriglutamate--homocysteine methyltransferase [Planctomycetes bacterium]|nr:5-methyltetrahydropteroyltriglutamate--homocysteine methyltransferase [Planctomycetota bacterium]